MSFEQSGKPHNDSELVDADAWIKEKTAEMSASERGIAFPEYILIDLQHAIEFEPTLQEPIEKMFEQCRRYTATVAEFESLSVNGYSDERFSELSASRGRTHDATITEINVAMEALKNNHFDISDWVEQYAYAKFAILLTLKRVALELEEQQKNERETHSNA